MTESKISPNSAIDLREVGGYSGRLRLLILLPDATDATTQYLLVVRDSEQVKRHPLELFACNVSILAGDKYM